MSYLAFGGYGRPKSSHRKSTITKKAIDLHSHVAKRGKSKGSRVVSRPKPGKTFAVGTRRQVFNGTARRTSGGLLKSGLFLGDDGRIKSVKASAVAKRNFNSNASGGAARRSAFRAQHVAAGSAAAKARMAAIRGAAHPSSKRKAFSFSSAQRAALARARMSRTPTFRSGLF